MSGLVIFYVILGTVIVAALTIGIMALADPSLFTGSSGANGGDQSNETDPNINPIDLNNPDVTVDLKNRAETINVVGCRYTYDPPADIPAFLIFSIVKVVPTASSPEFSTILSSYLFGPYNIPIDLYVFPVRGRYRLKIPSFYYGCVNGVGNTVTMTWQISDQNLGNAEVWYTKQMTSGSGYFPEVETGIRYIEADKALFCIINVTSEYVFLNPTFKIEYWKQ